MLTVNYHEKRHNLEDREGQGRITLRLMLGRQVMRMWGGRERFRIVSDDGVW